MMSDMAAYDLRITQELLTETKQQLASVQADLEEERRLLGLCKSKATVIHSRYTRARAERDELEKKRHETELEKYAYIDEVNALKRELVEFASEYRKLQADKTLLAGECNRTRKERDEAKADNVRFQIHLESMTKAAEANKKRAEAYELELALYKANYPVKQLSERIVEVTKERDELKNTNAYLEDELRDVQIHNTKLIKERDELRVQVTNQSDWLVEWRKCEAENKALLEERN